MKNLTPEQAAQLFGKYKKTGLSCFLPKFDGRKKEFKGITRQEWNAVRWKCIKRECLRRAPERQTRTQRVREILHFFENVPYIYEGDGMDDFNKFQRPASDGRGYVAICPGEPGNNYYTDDITAVAILKKRYKEAAISVANVNANI